MGMKSKKIRIFQGIKCQCVLGFSVDTNLTVNNSYQEIISNYMNLKDKVWTSANKKKARKKGYRLSKFVKIFY